MKKIFLAVFIGLLFLTGCSNDADNGNKISKEAKLTGDFATYVDSWNNQTDKGDPVTEQSLQFINDHLDMFMNHDEEAAQKLVNTEIDHRHLAKDIKSYSDVMYEDQGVIVSIQEVEDNTLEKLFTVIHVMNTDTEDHYQVLYFGKTDYLDNDEIKFTGLPLMDTKFANVTGGTTKLYMMLASNLEGM